MLCFMAGANSVFLGDRLLTTPNPEVDTDRALFERVGIQLQPTPTSTDAAPSMPHITLKMKKEEAKGKQK